MTEPIKDRGPGTVRPWEGPPRDGQRRLWWQDWLRFLHDVGARGFCPEIHPGFSSKSRHPFTGAPVRVPSGWLALFYDHPVLAPIPAREIKPFRHIERMPAFNAIEEYDQLMNYGEEIGKL